MSRFIIDWEDWFGMVVGKEVIANVRNPGGNDSSVVADSRPHRAGHRLGLTEPERELGRVMPDAVGLFYGKSSW